MFPGFSGSGGEASSLRTWWEFRQAVPFRELPIEAVLSVPCFRTQDEAARRSPGPRSLTTAAGPHGKPGRTAGISPPRWRAGRSKWLPAESRRQRRAVAADAAAQAAGQLGRLARASPGLPEWAARTRRRLHALISDSVRCQDRGTTSLPLRFVGCGVRLRTAVSPFPDTGVRLRPGNAGSSPYWWPGRTKEHREAIPVHYPDRRGASGESTMASSVRRIPSVRSPESGAPRAPTPSVSVSPARQRGRIRSPPHPPTYAKES
jgi:hypothetical protein